MRILGGILGSAALAALPLAAAAQSVEEYRLPAPTATPSTRAPGPVDPDNPVVMTPRAVPTPTTSPAPAPSAAAPTPTPSTRAVAAPTPRATPSATARAQVIASQPTASEAAPTLPLPLPTETASQTADVTLPEGPSALPPVNTTALPEEWMPLAAALAALLSALGGLLLWRRRKTSSATVAFEPPVVARPAPEPAPEPAPAPKPVPMPEPAFAAPPPMLEVALEAKRLNASLMATTLSYTVRITNNAAVPLSALAIEGDMISAHASLPPEQQIASTAQRLELRHAQVSLAPGESAEFSGDIRLPLTAITPIRAGDAAYFVPLARFRVEAAATGDIPLVTAQTFVIGELPDQPGAALRPFRLDLGPRTYSRIGQRAVN